jgi:hypothetical protein
VKPLKHLARRSSDVWQDVAGTNTAVALGAIGALHVAWGYVPWPAADYNTLVRYVEGGPKMPSRGACLVVGSGLLIAAYAVLAVIGTVPDILPEGLVRAGVWTLFAVLLARGVAGPLFSLRGSREFRFWNLVAYSPLCVLLGLGVLAAL